MNGSSATWWEDPQTDWTSGEPARAAQLLAAAYQDPATITAMAHDAGLDFESALAAGSPLDVWTSLLKEASSQGRVLDLAAAVLHDPGSEAFHPPLEHLLGDRLGHANARLATEYGLPESPEEAERVVKSLIGVHTEPGEEAVGRLEGIATVSAGFRDPMAFVAGFLDAVHRTALIEVAGRPRGTGVLVGPKLLLTAAHVFDPRTFPPHPKPAAEAVFNFQAGGGRSEAETGERIPVTDFLAGSLPTDAEANGDVRDWNAGPDRLDYALLELGYEAGDRPDGNPRGVYEPDETAYDFGGAGLLLIMQHPLGQHSSVSFIREPPKQNKACTRIQYGSNTLPGSSGSPIVDDRGRLVGLHHYFQDGKNQGVPFSAIASELLGKHANYFQPSADGTPATPPASTVRNPFRAVDLNGRPFVNRHTFRDCAISMAEGGQYRTLAITGASQSGISYSYQLAKHAEAGAKLCPALARAAPDGLAAIKIDLRDYADKTVEERRDGIVTDLLVALGMHQPLESLAQSARNLTTLKAWVAHELRDSEKQWWIFFDSVDSELLVRHGDLEELMQAVVLLADEENLPIRVVVAGQAAAEVAGRLSSWV